MQLHGTGDVPYHGGVQCGSEGPEQTYASGTQFGRGAIAEEDGAGGCDVYAISLDGWQKPGLRDMRSGRLQFDARFAQRVSCQRRR